LGTKRLPNWPYLNTAPPGNSPPSICKKEFIQHDL
jgi:hypothetical protein